MKLAGILVIAGWHVTLSGCSLLFEDPNPEEEAVDCSGTLATFDDVVGLENNPNLGIYEGLNFENTWKAYDVGRFNAVSESVSFDNNRTSGNFSFEGGLGRLHGLRVNWSGVDVTVTIGDGVNQDVFVELNSQTRTAYVTTNWTQPSSRIFIETSSFRFYLDDMCHTAL